VLDPATVQVLFADLQPQIVARSKTNPPDALARSAGVLAQVARLLHLPVHLSVVPEGGQTPELIPELARETKGVAQHSRMSASPFLDESTRAAIAASGQQHLIVAGFATEVVVLRRNVVPHGGRGVPTDRGEGRVTTSVVTLVTALTPDFSTESGRQVFGILQSLRLA
jgi:hypothetical protein